MTPVDGVQHSTVPVGFSHGPLGQGVVFNRPEIGIAAYGRDQLEAPTDGDSEKCVAIEPAVAQALLSSPADYYVNVHNADYPGGAVRGQLG